MKNAHDLERLYAYAKAYAAVYATLDPPEEDTPRDNPVCASIESIVKAVWRYDLLAYFATESRVTVICFDKEADNVAMQFWFD